MSHPSTTTAVTYPVAALERRFTAFAIDRILGWSLTVAAGVAAWFLVDDDPWLVLGVMVGVGLVLGLVLAVVGGVSGSSPGKALTGLRLVHHGTGTSIGVGRSLLRALVLGASGLPTFGLGIATLAWTAVEDRGRQRRGWHDHLCHSVVVDVRPVPEPTETVEDEAPRHIVNLTAMRLIPAPVAEPPTPERAPEHSVPRHLQPAPSRAATPPPAMPQPPPQPHAPPPSARRAAPPPPTPSSSRPMGRWRVELDDGEVLDLAGIALVGRRPEARNGEAVAHLVPLSSADMSVSKTHAQLGPTQDGTLMVMDRGSTNGTLLVRRGVTRQLTAGRPAALQPGDRVQFGDRTMTVVGRR